MMSWSDQSQGQRYPYKNSFSAKQFELSKKGKRQSDSENEQGQ